MFKTTGATSGRHQAVTKTQMAFEEKEVLLREVHHRVKNNLQVICSMLRLQERNVQDVTLLQVLRACRQRVMAMAMLHEQLHRAKDFSSINLGEYLRNLAASLFSLYDVNSAEIGLVLEVEDIPVAIDTAVPCGLIVNELLSNSLRHAFPDNRKGCITVALHVQADRKIELTIGDNGCGFEQTAQPGQTRTLGFWLVELLAAQINSIVERTSSSGTQYRLLFEAGPVL